MATLADKPAPPDAPATFPGRGSRRARTYGPAGESA